MSWHMVDTPTAISTPIFILSAECSGSTLLRYILDTHPEISCPPEIELWRVCRELHSFVSATLNVTLAAGSPEERDGFAWAEVRRLVSQVMDRYALEKGKRTWAEKSPMALLDTDALVQTFPEARYLCLHRHAMDFVHSVLEVCKYGWWPQFVNHFSRTPSNTVEALLEYWCDRAERLLAFEASHPAQSMRLTYEALVCETRGVAPRIFDFLGLAYSEDLLGRIFLEKHDHGPGDQKIRYTREIDSTNIGKGAAIPLLRVDPKQIHRANGLHA